MRTIIAAGGIETPDQEKRFAAYFSQLLRHRTGKARPVVCLMAQAQGEPEELIARNEKIYNSLGCDVEVLRTFRLKKPFAESFAAADAFFIPGGSTMNMLAVWHIRGFLPMLRAAYDAGKPIAGYSAGALCWFEKAAVPDPGAEHGYSLMDGLGWLKGSYVPHYTSSWRKSAFEKHIGDGALPCGIGCDDGVFALYENEALKGYYSVEAAGNAYQVTHSDSRAVTEIVRPLLVA